MRKWHFQFPQLRWHFNCDNFTYIIDWIESRGLVTELEIQKANNKPNFRFYKIYLFAESKNCLNFSSHMLRTFVVTGNMLGPTARSSDTRIFTWDKLRDKRLMFSVISGGEKTLKSSSSNFDACNWEWLNFNILNQRWYGSVDSLYRLIFKFL